MQKLLSLYQPSQCCRWLSQKQQKQESSGCNLPTYTGRGASATTRSSAKLVDITIETETAVFIDDDNEDIGGFAIPGLLRGEKSYAVTSTHKEDGEGAACSEEVDW
jgi:hypothetical protein